MYFIGSFPALGSSIAGTKSAPFDKKWTRPYIRIEDPFDEKNVTRAVCKYEQFCDIKQALKTAKERLSYGHCRLNDIFQICVNLLSVIATIALEQHKIVVLFRL